MKLPTTESVALEVTSDKAYEEIASFFDRFAKVDHRWRRRNRGYHDLVTRICKSLIPPGSSVLEIGSGAGDLLAALQPTVGVGIDVSSEMVRVAQRRYPHLNFRVASGEEYADSNSFDYILLSDVLPYTHDILAMFKNLVRLARSDTRIVIHSYSQTWRPVLALAEALRLKPHKPVRNWVAPEDVINLLSLAGFEPVTLSRRILFPKRIPLITNFLNGFVANMWLIKHLCLTYWVVARLKPTNQRQISSVSIICPCRDEVETIGRIVDEVPEIGSDTELIFVEGGSTDGTREEILRQIEIHPERRITLVDQKGTGKGDAVRCGFAHAKNDILMILDADLTVDPSTLPLFHELVSEGQGELINGSRLVYGRDRGSMRWLNIVGNKLFSMIFSWLLDQNVKDTLCGTKAISRRQYERIAEGRRFFGNFDPFGDFDLLLGAAKLNLKIVDLPVRYGRRIHGVTKIARFRHGWLLVRMSAFAFWKLKMESTRVR